MRSDCEVTQFETACREARIANTVNLARMAMGDPSVLLSERTASPDYAVRASRVTSSGCNEKGLDSPELEAWVRSWV